MINAAQLLEDLVSEEIGEQALYHALCELFPLQRIRSKRQHQLACKALERIMTYIHDFPHYLSKEEKAQLRQYNDALGVLIEDYERHHFSHIGKNIRGVEILKYLMREHGLQQVDLRAELGGQSVVSEILSGKRHFNISQVQALSKRFAVSPTVFFDN